MGLFGRETINDPYDTIGGSAWATVARAETTASSREDAKGMARAARDSAASLRGTGTGGWSDRQTDEYVADLDRYLGS